MNSIYNYQVNLCIIILKSNSDQFNLQEASSESLVVEWINITSIINLQYLPFSCILKLHSLLKKHCS
jgi:hypothetical protein